MLNKYKMLNIKHKKYVVSFAIFLVFIGIVFILILQQTPTIEKPNKEGISQGQAEQNQTEKVIVETEEEAEKWVEEAMKRENITDVSSVQSTLENAPLTSKPAFEVGEKYTYTIKTPPGPQIDTFSKIPNAIVDNYIFYNVTFSVDKKERINKTEYYLMSTEGSGEVIVGWVNIEEKKEIHSITTTPIYPVKWYVDAENGKKFSEDMEELDDLLLSRSASLLSKTYIPWMLKLSDGLKWTIRADATSTGRAGCNNGDNGMECTVTKEYTHNVEEQSYEVKGIEKINGKDCFKVENRIKICKNEVCRVSGIQTYWVDVKKRIAIKFQLWYDSLIVKEFELIDYKK